MNYKNLTDFRQISCFVMCVQAGSISRAAELLHMSQPSVSKAIQAMEDTLGIRLFERYAKGTVLTAAGEAVYPYAKTIMDSLRELQAIGTEKQTAILRISSNPSSWFADAFLAFYRIHKEDGIHYQIYSAGTREVVDRVRNRTDDVGFVYVVKNQKASFQQYLSRNYLEFLPLKETSVMLYGASGSNGEREAEQEKNLSNLRLIQRFPDEFSADNYRDLTDREGNSVEKAETVVTTNSEYIMTRILQTGDLQNISADYLTAGHCSELPGIPMTDLKEDRIVFGLIRRRGERVSELTEEFVHFIKEKLETE